MLPPLWPLAPSLAARCSFLGPPGDLQKLTDASNQTLAFFLGAPEASILTTLHHFCLIFSKTCTALKRQHHLAPKCCSRLHAVHGFKTRFWDPFDFNIPSHTFGRLRTCTAPENRSGRPLGPPGVPLRPFMLLLSLPNPSWPPPWASLWAILWSETLKSHTFPHFFMVDRVFCIPSHTFAAFDPPP